MLTIIIINHHNNDFELVSLGWNELNKIMICMITTKRVLERRLTDDPTNPSTKNQIEEIQDIIDAIDTQYPNWKGSATSLIDNSISETLTNKGIRNNSVTVIED